MYIYVPKQGQVKWILIPVAEVNVSSSWGGEISGQLERRRNLSGLGSCYGEPETREPVRSHLIAECTRTG